jgi:hypothetical protein
VDRIHVLERLAPALDKLGDAESRWLAAGERGAVVVDRVGEKLPERVPVAPVDREREASDQLENLEAVLEFGDRGIRRCRRHACSLTWPG